ATSAPFYALRADTWKGQAMTPAAHTIESILVAAVEIASDVERRAFVAQACAGDTALQRRVDELIQNPVPAASFLEAPAAPLAARVAAAVGEYPGTLIGPYKVLEQIGEGGMGAVFLVRDQRLRRDLALKVLRDRYHDRPDVHQRFLEEARIA